MAKAFQPPICGILDSFTDPLKTGILKFSTQWKENQKLFASRYKLVLPDEEELRREIERERRLIENAGAIQTDRRDLRKTKKRKANT